MNVREFLKANSLKQVELARYLGITEAAISNVVKEKSEFSKENLIKIINNPHGWDTSMLQSEPSQPSLVAEQKPSLSNVEILLRDMLAEKEAKIDALNEIIWELKAENARLREQLRIKGGDVAGAEDSFSAIA
jgi:transcriptional regulator with XRE-family HTH domain